MFRSLSIYRELRIEVSNPLPLRKERTRDAFLEGDISAGYGKRSKDLQLCQGSGNPSGRY